MNDILTRYIVGPVPDGLEEALEAFMGQQIDEIIAGLAATQEMSYTGRLERCLEELSQHDRQKVLDAWQNMSTLYR